MRYDLITPQNPLEAMKALDLAIYDGAHYLFIYLFMVAVNTSHVPCCLADRLCYWAIRRVYV